MLLQSLLTIQRITESIFHEGIHENIIWKILLYVNIKNKNIRNEMVSPPPAAFFSLQFLSQILPTKCQFSNLRPWLLSQTAATHSQPQAELFHQHSSLLLTINLPQPCLLQISPLSWFLLFLPRTWSSLMPPIHIPLVLHSTAVQTSISLFPFWNISHHLELLGVNKVTFEK